MTRLVCAVAIVAVLVYGPVTAGGHQGGTQSSPVEDVVLKWNAIAVNTLIGQSQNPFAQARYMAITQLAVFEAVNAITKKYDPYLGSDAAPTGVPVVGSWGASAEAAAIHAAYTVLRHYFPGSATALDLAYAESMVALKVSTDAKSAGITIGQTAADRMITLRLNDGSEPPRFFSPGAPEPGAWQITPSSTPPCPAGGGAFFQWQDITPFGVPSDGSQDWIEWFAPGPPPALSSKKYAKDYNEVKRVGSATSNSTDRPPDRADVARFYAPSSPSLVFNSAARQVAAKQGKSLSQNARALALLSMATNDAFVVSFWTKYHYKTWRPETAIHGGSLDGNGKTVADLTWAPYIPAPCFPGYPSNHAAGSTSAAEILRRIYGGGGHSITLANPVPVPGVVLHYTRFKQITDDVDDARVYGGIHFRFDQEGGARLARDVASYIYRNNLRRAKYSWDWNENDGENEGENESDDD